MKLRYLLWPLALLVGIPVALLVFALTTETGLSVLVAATQRILPGSLTYDRIEGRLIGPLSIENLRYTNGELDIRLRSAEFNWFPSRLLKARLQIEKLHSDGFELRLPKPGPEESPPDAEPFQLSDIPLPIHLEITDITLTDTRVWPYRAPEPIVVDRAHLRAKTEDRTVKLEAIEVSAPQGEAKASGQLELAGANPLALTLDATYKDPTYGPLTATAVINGELDGTLNLRVDTRGLAEASLTGEASRVLSRPGWSMTLDLPSLTLDTFVPDLAGSALSARLKTQGNLDTFQVTGHAAATALPEMGSVRADLNLSGGLDAIRINELTLSSSEGPLSLTARADIDLQRQTVNADAHWQAAAWPLVGESLMESPRGELKVEGTSKDYRLALEADLSSTQSGPLKALVAASGTDRGVTLSKLSLKAQQGDLALNVRGELSFADLSFEADGQWQALTWPLIGEPQVESPKGSFQAKGNVKDYQFDLDTDVLGPAIPRTELKLRGRGSDQALKSLALDARLLNGEIRSEVSATWLPTVSWQASVVGSGLNPGAQWPDLPGKLGLNLSSEGELARDGALRASARLEDLSGVLRGQDVRGEGDVEVNGANLTIEDLIVGVGNARFNASGSLTDDWDLRWSLETPDLGRLLPGAAGAIDGSGNIQGPRDKPRAAVDLTIAALSYAGTGIRSLQAQGTVDISGATRSDITLTGSDLQLAGQNWSNLEIQATGTPAVHSLQSGLQGDLGRLRLELSGNFDQQDTAWSGRLTELAVQNTAVGDWSLSAPLPLRASAEQASAGRSCLVSPPTRICLEGDWSADNGGTANVSLERLDAERFAELIPEGIDVETGLSGELSATLGPDGSLQGNGVLRLRPGRVVTETAGAPFTVTLTGGELLRARSDGRDASASLSLGLGSLGQVNATVGIGDITGQRRLDGKINAAVTDLKVVSSFAPQVDDVTGRIEADLDLSGTPGAMIIGGAVRLQNGGADIPQFDTQIRNVTFTAQSDGQGTLMLSGGASSGPGSLQLSGRFTPAEGALEMNVKGRDFQVANAPDIQASVSPDITVGMQPGSLKVDGELVVPRAFISPAGAGGVDGANRVSASSDVVIVRQGDGSEQRNEDRALAVDARVRIILGNDVRVEAFDFAGNLKGNLLIEQSPRLAPRATGVVEVEAGEYRVFGQTLKIERGRVLFSNSPLGNPSLDLRVTRRIEQAAPVQSSSSWEQDNVGAMERIASSPTGLNTVIAGAQVTGTLRQPKLTLFSQPPMPDSAIMSFLVLGRAPAAAETASLMLGRYLSPDLWVGYGIGFSADSENTFLMRYRLSRKFSLRANSSGEHSGADLLYSIELR